MVDQSIDQMTDCLIDNWELCIGWSVVWLTQSCLHDRWVRFNPWLIQWLADKLIGFLVDRMACWLIVSLTYCMITWLLNWLIDWSIDWRIHWLMKCLQTSLDGLADWLVYWLDRLTGWLDRLNYEVIYWISDWLDGCFTRGWIDRSSKLLPDCITDYLKDWESSRLIALIGWLIA